MNSSLKSDTALYGAAMLAERLLGLLLLPLLTRRLAPVEYGIWAQTLVVSSVLMPLMVFCLPAAIVKFFSAGLNDAERRQWMLRTLGAAIGLFIFLGMVAWPAQSEISFLVYGSAQHAAYVPVLVTLLGADALMDLLVAYLRSAFRMRWIATLMLLRGGLRFGFLVTALVALEWSFEKAFLVLALIQLGVVSAVFLRELGRPGALRAPAPPAEVSWRALLAFSAPLVLVSVLTSVNAFADRFVLTHLLGLDNLAVYAAVSSLVSLAGLAYTVLGFTLFPVLSRQWAAGDLAGARVLANDTVRVFLFLAVPYVLWLAGAIGSLLPLMTGSYSASPVVPLLMGAGVVGFGLYQIMLYLLLLSGRGMRAAWMMLGVAALNAMLNLALVPSMGLTGAALSAAVSNIALAVSAYLAADLRFPWRAASRGAAAAVAAGGVTWWLDRTLQHLQWPGVLGSFVTAGLICVVADLTSRSSVIRAVVRPKVSA